MNDPDMVLLLHLNLESNTDDYPSGIDASVSANDFIVSDVKTLQDFKIAAFGVHNQSCYCSQFGLPSSDKLGTTACSQILQSGTDQVCDLYTQGIIQIGSLLPNSTYEIYMVGITSTDQEFELAKSVTAATTTDITVPGMMDPPQIIENSGHYLEIQWTQVLDDGGADAVMYQVFLNGFLAKTYDENVLAASFDNMNPQQSYAVTVAAVNVAGAGPQSELSFVVMSPLSILAAPEVLVIQNVSGGTVTFEAQNATAWNASTLFIIEQRESMQDDFTSSITRYNDSSVVVYRLHHDTSYVFRAYFVDSDGIQSDYSESMTVETGAIGKQAKTPTPALINVTGIRVLMLLMKACILIVVLCELQVDPLHCCYQHH